MAKNYLRDKIKDDLRPGETKENKISRCGNFLSGMIFYSFTSIYLFWNFGDTLRPRVLGGTINLG